MNPKAENSCAERRAKLSQQTAPRKSEKNSRGQTVLQTVGVDLAQVSPKRKKFYRRGKAFWVREGENKVQESDQCFWIGDKNLTIKTDYETV